MHEHRWVGRLGHSIDKRSLVFFHLEVLKKKSLPLLALASMNATSLMWPTTSECATSNNLFACNPLSLGSAAPSCCPSLHVLRIDEDAVQRISLKFMPLIILLSVWTHFTSKCPSQQFILNMGIFHNKLLVPHNTTMDMNNAMMALNITILSCRPMHHRAKIQPDIMPLLLWASLTKWRSLSTNGFHNNVFNW